MIPQIKKKIFLTTISLSLMLTSCSSTAEYKAFSSAGILYSESLNELLKCSGKVGLDASSYRMIQDDAEVNFSPGDYDAQKEKDEKRLELINQIREQILLFRRYFEMIGELAGVGDTVPTSVGNEIVSIANGFTAIQVKITGNADFPNSEFNAGLGKLTNLIISSEIKGAIRKELETRKRTLQESLLIHKLLVNKLKEEDINDLKIIKSYLEKKKVSAPLTDAANPLTTTSEVTGGWVASRDKVINIQKLMWDLETEVKIVDNFAQIFEEMVTDKANLPRAQYLAKRAANSKILFASLCTYDSYKQARSANRENMSSHFLFKGFKPVHYSSRWK